MSSSARSVCTRAAAHPANQPVETLRSLTSVHQQMDFELSLASKRLEKEAAKRKQAEQAKLERQRLERERAEAKRLELERAAAAERQAAAEAAERLRARHEQLLERNKGVWTSQRLVPQLSLSAEAKGIRRRSDKISLPRSFGASLSEQHDHATHGAMFFELAVDGRPPTHGALLDFEAPEGVVGLPPKVLRCLGLDSVLGVSAQPAGTEPTPAFPLGTPPLVTVTYRSLQPGTFAKLQPVSAAFQRELGDIKTALELELATHATLTEGDILTVRSLEDGQPHELRVISLLPEHAVSVVETDLEVDIAPSVEAEAAQAAERARVEAEAAAARQAAEEARAAEAVAAAAAAARSAEAAAARAAAAAALPPEPAEAPGTVNVLVKLPSGERRTRRFSHAQPLALLFAFVETLELSRGAEEGEADSGQRGFRLASQYPRRVWERSACSADSPSLGAAGLGGTQEALFVELL